MVSINTNLSSFLVKQQLSKSTYSLNKAIERMTTGFKVNHASDNAANYSIIQNMSKDISAYDVAADNVAMGSDFSATAQDSLTLVSTHMERIRDLLSQAANGTYGEQSRKAIQSEIDARLAEVNRIFQSTEYNGVQMFNSAILPSTLNINIADLNLKAGSFDVNVDGVNYTINLAKEDSLYSIISKLQAVGVDADFNEESGVFTVELDASKITDNGTGFVDVLAMGSTDGYIAENLQTNEVHTILASANADSTLSSIGVTDGSFTIIDSEGNETTGVISVDATISELFNQLWTHQISGSINSSGVVTFDSPTGNHIGGALAEQLGINVDIVETEYQGLTINTTNTLTHSFVSNATADTTLDKLGVVAGESLIVKDNEGNDLYTFTADNDSIKNTALGELFNNLVDAGYLTNANVNNGVVSISSDINNYVTGSIASRFGITLIENDNPVTTGITQTSSNAITYNETKNANSNMKLAELGITSGDTFTIKDNSGANIYTFTADDISIQNITIGDFLDDLVSDGYLTTAELADGVISLSSNVNNYATGSIADKFGIKTNTENYSETIVTGIASTDAVTYVKTQMVSGSTTLADAGIEDGESLDVLNQNGLVIYRYTAYASLLNKDTLQDAFDALRDYIDISIDDGKISVSSDKYNYLSGDMADKLGINKEKQDISVTTGTSQTSSTSISYIRDGAIDKGILLESLGVQDGDSLSVRNNSGEVVYTYIANSESLQSDTLASITDFLSNMGYFENISITNGVISLSSEASNYITGEIADKLNIGVTTTDRYETVAISQTSSEAISGLSFYTTLSDLGLEEASFRIADGTVVNLNSTDYILSSFNAVGLNASISNEKITINGGVNNYIKDMSSDLAQALKIQVGEGASYEGTTNTYHYNTDSNPIIINGKYKMTTNTTLGDLGLSNATIETGKTTISLISTDSIYDKLQSAGLNVELANGILKIYEGSTYLKNMTSELAGVLNMQVGEGYTYNTSVHNYWVNPQTAQQSIQTTYTLTEDTTLADLGLNSETFTLNNNTVVSINSSESIYSKMQDAGLIVSLEDGIMTIDGDNDVYLKDISTNLANILKLQAGEGNSYTVNNYTIHTNSNSDSIKITSNNTLSTETTLGDLGMVSASFTMNDNTVINLNSSDSIYEKMQDAGLDVRVGIDGRLSIVGDNNSYIKSMSSNLADALKIQTGEGSTYEVSHNITHSNSNSKTQTYLSTATLTSANSSTYRMSDWGLKTNSKIYTNNEVINVSRTDTVATLISKLNQAGIGATVNDENGTLEIVNRDNAYITSADSALRSMLGFEAGEGKTYNSTTVTHRSDTTSKVLKESIKHTIAKDATEATLLKEFNTEELSIQGDLVFDMADGQKVVKITSDDTISSLIEKLKDIGIKAIFKNQSLSISGNKNSVLLLDNSSSTTSFLADLLGLEHTDKLEDITCSNDLNALADSIYADKFNTPEFLCIQAGIKGNDSDMIKMDMRLSLGRVTFNAADTKSASKGLDKIDELISKISAKQTEYGAFSNRMESAADSITIALQNLVSSRSTLQDADIAVESSNYIRAQILQQAAATLLATANQTPAIAIQLL